MSGPQLSEAIASAALALIGTPYRRNGRDPLTGLDCIGVVCAALAATGHRGTFPTRSTLRRRTLPCLETLARQAGLLPVSGATKTGDIVLVRCSPVQWHALVAVSSSRFVHAHAGLRRVVLSVEDPSWARAGHWHLPPIASPTP